MKFDEKEFLSEEEREAIKAGPRTFDAGQMIACEACRRASPPTRMNCLYCGARLPAPAAGEDLRRPALRPLEDWESGWNVVLAPAAAPRRDETAAPRPAPPSSDSHDGARHSSVENSSTENSSVENSSLIENSSVKNPSVENSSARDSSVKSASARDSSVESAPVGLRDGALDEAASLVRMTAEELREVLAAGVALPMARTGDADEAALLVRRLCALGFGVELIADDELAVCSRAPRRVRGLEFDGEGLAGRAAGGEDEARERWGALALLVEGRVYERRTETVGERARDRGEPGESSEFGHDEPVLDLFFDASGEHWRVSAGGFDYSCLGARKSLLASENFARLCELLRERAPRARFDDSYRRVRRLLRFAWPPEERDLSGGLRRARPGKFNAAAVRVVSNETQFTRYGRLLARHADCFRPTGGADL